MKSPDHYAALLRDRLEQLRGRAREIEQELDQPVSKDWEEQAVEREDDEVLEGLGALAVAEIQAIEAALDRIEAGTYGICVKCGDEIPEERLEVVPHTPLCQNCAGAR